MIYGSKYIHAHSASFASNAQANKSSEPRGISLFAFTFHGRKLAAPGRHIDWRRPLTSALSHPELDWQARITECCGRYGAATYGLGLRGIIDAARMQTTWQKRNCQSDAVLA